MKPISSLTRRVSRAALFCALAALPIGSFAQQTVFENDFADGDRSAWFTSGKNHLLKADAAEGGSMTQQISGTTAQFLLYFTEAGDVQELAVGEALRLTLNFRISAPGSVPNSWVRLGLFNSEGFRIARNGRGVAASEFANYRGYGLFGTLSGGWKLITKRTGEANGLLVTGTPWEHLKSERSGAQFDLLADTPYTLVLTLRRQSADSLSIEATCTGGGSSVSYSTTDAQTPFTGFDTFALVANADFARSITVTRAQVETLK